MTNTNDFPNDITINILMKLPKKSILRFKLVCKSWRSLIEDPQFTKHHYYLNQILKAFKKDREYYSIIEPPSVITHQFCINFVNSPVNSVFLLAIQFPDKIVFWNPEKLRESTTIRLPIPNTTQFALGEHIFLAKFSRVSYFDIPSLEVSSMSKNGSTSCSWRKMLEIEEPGPLLLKKGTKDFLFYRSDKNEYVVYDSKTRELNEVTDTKLKLKEFKIAGPQVLLFIDRTYAETLVSPNATVLEV